MPSLALRSPAAITRCLLTSTLALCALTSVTAHAHDFCVSTSQELQDALDAASNGGMYNGQDNIVRLVRGTYRTGAATGNAPFFFYSPSSAKYLLIEGGYGANCMTLNYKAAQTVIDGHGANGAMILRNALGKIGVNWLTLTNGESTQPGAGLQVNYLTNVSGTVDIQSVIISNNHSTVDGGGLYASGAGDELNIQNSLFADNSADGNYGAAYLTGYGTYSQFISNTVTQNTTPSGPNAVGGVYFGGTQAFLAYNNIFWNNTTVPLYTGGPPATLVYNDFGNPPGGTPPSNTLGNVSLNPQFVDSTNNDFHLSADSPLLSFSPEHGGGVDLEGHVFPVSGQQDIGAYQDTLFSDDLETHVM
jgi:predicted outer membrane repeat protein